MKCDSQASLLAHTLTGHDLRHKPKAKVVTIIVHQGEATDPSSVTNVVDPMRCGCPIVRNNAGHVCQATMPRLDDVLTDGRNRGVH
jgi:signal transduction protein with GAF and PtsI domain